MSICYSTERVSVQTGKLDFTFDPLKCNANDRYMDHYQNFLTLNWFADHGTMKEKQQAQTELEICRRKMKYWERQPHINAALLIEQKKLLNRKMAA